MRNMEKESGEQIAKGAVADLKHFAKFFWAGEMTKQLKKLAVLPDNWDSQNPS